MIKKIISKNYRYIPKFLLRQFLTPRNLVIEPIAGCNVVCSACPQDQLKRKKGTMTLGNFNQIINKTTPKSIGLYFMGEPFLNPYIFDMIESANKKDIKTTINTNGSTLVNDYEKIAGSGLDKIAVSVDGYTQETFELYRHGINRDNIYDGLKKLSAMNKGPHIQIRVLAFESTMKEIGLIVRELRSMNIHDIRIIEPIITGWGGKENPDLDKLGSSGRVKNVKPKVCPSLFRMAVTWDGELLPCCNDVHGENSFGNLLSSSSYIDLMWGSDMWRRKAERGFNICNHCYEDDD